MLQPAMLIYQEGTQPMTNLLAFEDYLLSFKK